VCIYIRQDIAFNARTDFNHQELEETFIDILFPKSKPILCGVILILIVLQQVIFHL